MKYTRACFAVILLFIVLVFIHLRLTAYAFDDAYIHFRIARNFIQSGQPYYNIGQPVMASSSSGWTVVLTALFAVFGTSPVVVSIANALFLTAGAALVYHLFRQITPQRRIACAGGAILYIGFLIGPSTGLMETPFTMLLLACGLLLYSRRNAWSLVIFGTLPFFRLELIFFMILILAAAYFTHQFIPRKLIALPLLGMAPWLLYDLIFFRRLIPNTIYAKHAGYALPLFNNILSIGHSIFHIGNTAWMIYGTVFFPFATLLLFRQRRFILPFEYALLLSGTCVIAFYLYGGSIIFQWYTPLYILPLSIPVFRLINDRAPFLKRSFAALAVLPAGILLGQYSYASMVNPLAVDDLAFNARTIQYLETGRVLYEKYPTACLMTSEIGGLGWSFKGCILDGMGLASPEAIRFHQRQLADIGNLPIAYIQEKNPQIIVSLRMFMLDFDPKVLSSDYIITIQPSLTGSKTNPLYVFVRKNLSYNDPNLH